MAQLFALLIGMLIVGLAFAIVWWLISQIPRPRIVSILRIILALTAVFVLLGHFWPWLNALELK